MPLPILLREPKDYYVETNAYEILQDVLLDHGHSSRTLVTIESGEYIANIIFTDNLIEAIYSNISPLGREHLTSHCSSRRERRQFNFLPWNSYNLGLVENNENISQDIRSLYYIMQKNRMMNHLLLLNQSCLNHYTLVTINQVLLDYDNDYKINLSLQDYEEFCNDFSNFCESTFLDNKTMHGLIDSEFINDYLEGIARSPITFYRLFHQNYLSIPEIVKDYKNFLRVSVECSNFSLPSLDSIEGDGDFTFNIANDEKDNYANNHMVNFSCDDLFKGVTGQFNLAQNVNNFIGRLRELDAPVSLIEVELNELRTTYNSLSIEHYNDNLLSELDESHVARNSLTDSLNSLFSRICKLENDYDSLNLKRKKILYGIITCIDDGENSSVNDNIFIENVYHFMERINAVHNIGEKVSQI